MVPGLCTQQLIPEYINFDHNNQNLKLKPNPNCESSVGFRFRVPNPIESDRFSSRLYHPKSNPQLYSNSLLLTPTHQLSPLFSDPSSTPILSFLVVAVVGSRCWGWMLLLDLARPLSPPILSNQNPISMTRGWMVLLDDVGSRCWGWMLLLD